MATDTDLIISADWYPLPEIVASYYDTLGVKVRSFREPLTRAVKNVVIPSIQQNFDVEGRPDRWAETSELTNRKKQSQGYSLDILQMRGRLKKQAAMQTAWDITSDSATTKSFKDFNGGLAKYGDLHQVGGIVGKGTGTYVPARPFMVIQEEDVVMIDLIFAEWLVEKTVASGFKVKAGRA